MFKSLLLGMAGIFASVPTSTNFTLKTYDFGSGADSLSSSNYNLQASPGAWGGELSSSNYGLPAGVRASSTIGTPGIPAFTNPDSSYNRLHITLDVTGFPADVKYLIAVSDDNFATAKYVQPDQTIGSTLSISNYQTYATWGGASGFWVLELEPGTSYGVKVAALQGPSTGSKFGTAASAATVQPSLTFSLSTSLTSSPPFTASFSSLPAGSVSSANATIIASVTTNALNGGDLLIKSQNSGLVSQLFAYTITSSTTDLTSAPKGYGAQVTDSSGGLSALSPFNGAGHNIGGLSNVWQKLASFTGPISSASITTTLKAKTDASVPASTDYTDALTISIAPVF